MIRYTLDFDRKAISFLADIQFPDLERDQIPNLYAWAEMGMDELTAIEAKIEDRVELDNDELAFICSFARWVNVVQLENDQGVWEFHYLDSNSRETEMTRLESFYLRALGILKTYIRTFPVNYVRSKYEPK